MTDHPLTPERVDAFRDRHIDPCSYAQAIFDAGRSHERTNPEDGRPWEPLSKGDPLNVGDEVRCEADGIARTAIVARVDADGDPWASQVACIGDLRFGTWYVRRAASPLPPERDGVVLVPADGHESITTTDGQEFARLTFTTKQSLWYGPNLAARPGDWVIQTTSPGRLTPGAWKVADQ